ncbi:FAD-dependent oxidoreductase [Chloroflexota bacterium]
MIHSSVKELFSPLAVGKLTLKNRTVMPAMGLRLAEADGGVSDRYIDYFVERAKNGIGLIIVGMCSIWERPGSGAITIHSDTTILRLNELVEAIQEWGTTAAIQLVDHGGVVNEVGELIPKGADQCTEQEIEDLIENFSLAAVRAKKAGFDAIEIHGAHGYLIAQFLSPLTNHRNDKYGGDVERRAAFLLSIVKRIKEEVGQDFPLSVRISADEYLPGGITLADASITAQLLEAAGVSILSITAGKRPESFEWSVQPMSLPRACLVPLAAAIKKVVHIPVITVGRINDPLLANQILVEGKADLVAMGRALLADAEILQKASGGAFEDIRKCMACMYCHQRNFLSLRPKCAINPALGRERNYLIKQTKKAKKILIAGGGPAGLEASRILRSRGHDVVLCEQDSALGGQIRLAAVPPYKAELNNIIEYLSVQIQKLGVDVRLRTSVDKLVLADIRPDVIVIAIGGKPIRLSLKGINNARVLTAQEVLAQKNNIGQKVVVVGGGFIGCEVAEFLAEQGKQVVIVEKTGQLAQNATHPFLQKMLLSRIANLDITVHCNSELGSINEDSVVVTHNSHKSYELAADNVVLALGSQSNLEWAEELRTSFAEVYTIGECTGRTTIQKAIADGARIGLWL